MTITKALRFQTLRLWFPIRRAFRFLKRNMKEALSWIITSLIFLPLALAILYFFNLIYANERLLIPEQLIILILGSILIVSIKDLQDKENNRRSALNTQFRIYYNFKFSFEDTYKEFILNDESCTVTQLKGPSEETTDIVSKIERLIPFANIFIQELEQNDLIDWNDYDSKQLYETHFKLLSLQNRLDSSDLNIPVSEIKGFLKDLKLLIEATRKPWNYPIDVARNKMLEGFVRDHGTEVPLSSTTGQTYPRT